MANGYADDRFDSWDELRDVVGQEGGIVTVEIGVLRDLHGVRKLGTHVRDNISNELRGRGLAHYPDPLPTYQSDLVRVYKMGTPVAEAIDAVLHPSEAHDDELRRLVEGDAAETLRKIRELLEDL